ncbi:MAG: hypothetical protein U0Q18_00495 [Bryobacteraceae bacterium]
MLLVIAGNFLGSLFLRLGMRDAGPLPSALSLGALEPFLNGWIVAGVALMALGAVSQLALLSWADLSYVLPLISVVYILAAFGGWVILHESISAARWGGIALISIGAVFVTRTRPCRQSQAVR